jgi:hypothetical protein
MDFSLTSEHPAGSGFLDGGEANTHTSRRFRRYSASGGDVVLVAPSAGADADVVMYQSRHYDTPGQTREAYTLYAGRVVKVETGGSFSAGASIVTDSSGRAVAAGSGVVLGRALNASSGTGQYILMVVASGR